MIKIHDLHKSYKMGSNSLHVLKGINFDVEEGELVAIMGSSGSGKSTLLHIIGFLDDHTGGNYYFNGKQHDDCLQVVEQTLPYFSPQYSVAVKPLPGLSDIVEDVPIILQSTTFADNYEGNLEDRRTIIYTLTFDMKINMWGPVCKTPRAVIETIDIDFFDDTLGMSYRSTYNGTGFVDSSGPFYLETQRVEAQQPPEPFHPVNQDSDYNIVTDVINEHSPDSDFENPTVPHPYE